MAETIYKTNDTQTRKGSNFRKGARFKKGHNFNKGTDFTRKAGGTKSSAGGRLFGKFIGKMARGVSGHAENLGFTTEDKASADKQSTYQMGVESYQRALETGDQRRLRGIRSAGIIVHAERPSSDWRGNQELSGKVIDDIDELARVAYDRLVDSDNNAAYVVYMNKNKIVSQVAFPEGYPNAASVNSASLKDSIIKYLNNAVAPEDVDGYYIIQNSPSPDMNEDDTSMHSAISNDLDGYLGGIVLSPGFQYGFVHVNNNQAVVQKRQLPIPTPGKEFVAGYDGPYTVLNTHQELLGQPTIDENKSLKMSNDNISHISQTIERARDTTLLVYSESGKTVAVQEIPNKLFKKTRKFNEYIGKQMEKYGSDEIIAVVDEKKIAGSKPTVSNSIKNDIDLKIAKMNEITLTAEVLDSNTLV